MMKVASVGRRHEIKNSVASIKRILVVEDGPSACQFCSSVLIRKRLEVGIAANGKAAQDMVEKKPYDLYLIDMKMPEMNGSEFYQWLQEKFPKVSTRVIFTNGDVMGQDTKDFLEQARLFLPKPFSPRKIQATVHEALKVIGR